MIPLLFWLDVAILVVFLSVIVLIILEKNRAFAALLGTVIIVIILLAWGIYVPQAQAIHVSEFITEKIELLSLIIGLMLIVTILLETGIFEFIALKMIRLTKGRPFSLFLVFILMTYGISIIMENIGAILIIAPLTITTCRILKMRKALPYFLVAEQLATVPAGFVLEISSIPNMIIASELNFAFFDFIVLIGPLSLIIVVVIIIYMKKFYLDKEDRLKMPSENLRMYIDQWDEYSVVPNMSIFRGSAIILGAIIVTLVIFHEYAYMIALIGGLFLLIFSKQNIGEVLRKLDWVTLFFLIGVFIIVDTMNSLGILSIIGVVVTMTSAGLILPASILTLWLSGFTSAFVDNIPITLTLTEPIKQIISLTNASFFKQKLISSSLVIGASLGGCFTPIGSPSGVLTLQIAKERGIKELDFKFFIKIGFIITFINFFLATGYLVLLNFFLV
ncbi:MAG: SLC13 family permease [Candidatus Helarchaeota archaeon]